MIFHILITEEDVSYLGRLKPLLQGHTGHLSKIVPTTVTEVVMKAKTQKAQAIITTSQVLLAKLVNQQGRSGVTLDNYAGSIFKGKAGDYEIPILILNPLNHLFTTKTGNFLFSRYISKLTQPDKWFHQTEFSWEVGAPETLPGLYEYFKEALFISVDIETPRGKIAPFPYCVGFCGCWIDAEGKFTTHTVVIPTDTLDMWNWVKAFNKLPGAKVTQNGQYDNSYFLRYAAPMHNWIWDTLNLFHSWYSELPKRLDFITSFAIRDIQYWKDEGKSGNLEDQYRYNARDCWATMNAFLALIKEMPGWALRNYVEEFPKVYPCLLMSMEGLDIDPDKQEEMRKEQEAIKVAELRKLEVMTATPNFNPGSPKQKLQLFHILGNKDLKSTGKAEMTKIALRHPVCARFVRAITAYQKSSKLLSTYINIKLLNGRWFYAFNPAGTDTARLASKKSHFWCGTQIQNTPPYAKKAVRADSGYELAERDYSQSEARCVAYLSGDDNLISTVESERDYHGLNAERFFGIPYEEIVRTTTKEVAEYDGKTGELIRMVVEVCHETLNKAIRDLAKRTNHGANYNMGARVMLETMGEENVLKAKLLLGFPRYMPLLDVCQQLLNRYAAAYPKVKGDWYNELKYQVTTHRKLVSPLGWTRYCFGDPNKNKRDLNAIVAHSPQNLSVAIINRCLMRLFYFQLSAKNWNEEQGKANFRLKAQIHDSVFYQYLIGADWVRKEVEKMMKYPVMIKGKSMLIPSDENAGKTYWGDLK